jgi:hypothetical protein
MWSRKLVITILARWRKCSGTKKKCNSDWGVPKFLQLNYAHHSEANGTERLSRDEDEDRCATTGLVSRHGVGGIVRKNVKGRARGEIIVGGDRKNGHYGVVIGQRKSS